MWPLCTILLWSIAAVLLVNVTVILRRRGVRAVGFVLLLVANFALALWAVRAGPSARILCLSALVLFCLLVVLPAVLASLTRRYFHLGRLSAARRLLELRQLLQPGLGLEQERQLLRGIELIQQGRAEEALQEAQQQLERSEIDPVMRLALVERVLALLLLARRCADAIAIFERYGGTELAQASPSVCSSAVRAYGEIGAFAQAAECQRVLEGSAAASDPSYAGLLNGTRLAFLAHLGRADEVERVLEGSSFMPELSQPRRLLWKGLAHQRGGDGEGARRLWQRVADQTDDADAREAAMGRLGSTDVLHPPAQPDRDIEALVELVVQRAMVYRGVPRARGRLWQTCPVTTVLLVAVALVYLGLQLAGRTVAAGDEGWLLLRFGANFPPVSLGAEPWRLLSSMFLHGGPYHLHFAFNAYALYLLGRLTEQMYGPWRFWVIYMMAGLAGSVASAAHGGGLLSVGASGAIFGLLGAAVAGLRELRGYVPEGWRRQLFINLLVVIALQLLIGWQVPVIDNAAHVGGLLGGGVLGWLIRPRRTDIRRPWRQRVIIVWGITLVGMAIVCAFFAVARGPEQLLRDMPQRTISRSGLQMRCPTHWVVLDRASTLALQDPLMPFAQVLPTAQHLGAEPLAGDSQAARQMMDFRLRLIVEHMSKMEGVRRVLSLEEDEMPREDADEQVLSSLGMRDVVLRQIAPDLFRGELRLLIGMKLVHQLIYFRRVARSLHTIIATAPARHYTLYRPLFDQVAATASATAASVKGEAAR